MKRFICFTIAFLLLFSLMSCTTKEPEIEKEEQEIEKPPAIVLPPTKGGRFETNPIIHSGLSDKIGRNINGPSLIRVPSWVDNALGKYYLYFADHSGTNIRLAYSDTLEGPWKIYEPGTLNIEDIEGHSEFNGHIGSPDVHIDNEKKEIRMYFHAPYGPEGQGTGIAVSKDGIDFNLLTADNLGPPYFRVFNWDNTFYAIAKNKEISGELYKSDDGISFTKIMDIIPRMRHGAVLIRDGKLIIFYSRGKDSPERILASTIDLDAKIEDWEASDPIEVLSPEFEYEGAMLPNIPSDFGKAKAKVNQLRDPGIYEEDGKVYLLYSVAGESGIAIAEITELVESIVKNTVKGDANMTYKRKELIYKNNLSKENDIKNFVMEGMGKVTFPNGRMRLESLPAQEENKKSNIVYWCDQNFPDNIEISWDFYPIEEPGLCMFFFAAKGRNGESIFSSNLAQRNGAYDSYTEGDINTFHIAYFRRGKEEERAFQTCNLRKSHGFHLVAQTGDPIPSIKDATPPYRISVTKYGGNVLFKINDMELINWEDDGKTYGEVLTNGMIGFRQMSPMVAEYANLTVYSVEAE